MQGSKNKVYYKFVTSGQSRTCERFPVVSLCSCNQRIYCSDRTCCEVFFLLFVFQVLFEVNTTYELKLKVDSNLCCAQCSGADISFSNSNRKLDTRKCMFENGRRVKSGVTRTQNKISSAMINGMSKVEVYEVFLTGEIFWHRNDFMPLYFFITNQTGNVWSNHSLRKNLGNVSPAYNSVRAWYPPKSLCISELQLISCTETDGLQKKMLTTLFSSQRVWLSRSRTTVTTCDATTSKTGAERHYTWNLLLL